MRLLRILGMAVLASACTLVGTSASSSGAALELRVHSELQPDTADHVEIAASLTNTGTESVVVEYGACALNVQFRDPAQQEGRPLWELDRYSGLPNYTAFGRICPLYASMVPLAPGETLLPSEFRTRLGVEEILSDSLPEGSYAMRVLLRVDQGEFSAPAGTVHLRRAPGASLPE